MKINDAVIGAVLVLFGAAVAWRSQYFPVLPHQHYGAALFPTIIGFGMVVCGLLLIGAGVRAHVASGEGWVRMGEWVGSNRHVISVLMIPLGLVLYILIADLLGFFLTSALLLFGWMVWLRGRWLSSLVVAVVVTLVIDVAFSHFLLVPLPWGVFQPLAWWQ
jgi:putative tricarboxylic transport membrane protein